MACDVASVASADITKVIDSIPWVRCASGNVFSNPFIDQKILSFRTKFMVLFRKQYFVKMFNSFANYSSCHFFFCANDSVAMISGNDGNEPNDVRK